MTGCQRAPNNAEMRENGPGPTGWLVKSALAALPRLEIAPLFPAHGALLSPISRANTTTNNFETASNAQCDRYLLWARAQLVIRL